MSRNEQLSWHHAEKNHELPSFTKKSLKTMINSLKKKLRLHATAIHLFFNTKPSFFSASRANEEKCFQMVMYQLNVSKMYQLFFLTS